MPKLPTYSVHGFYTDNKIIAYRNVKGYSIQSDFVHLRLEKGDAFINNNLIKYIEMYEEKPNADNS